MFERPLLPLDGSSLAELIIPQLAPILARPATRTTLLCIVLPPLVGYFEEATTQAALEAEAEKYVTDLAARLQAEGIEAKPLVSAGDPAETILKAAERRQSTLIALSTHGRTGLSEWVFGSVTEKVVHSSPAPLLVVRSFQPGGNGAALRMPAVPLAFKKILVPIDEVFEPLVNPVAECAALFGSQVTVLHVVDRAGHREGSAKEAADRLARAGAAVETWVREGNAAQVILKTARDGRFDLIALATHGRKGASRWALGSVTEKIVRSATVPLLITREREPGHPAALSPVLGILPSVD